MAFQFNVPKIPGITPLIPGNILNNPKSALDNAKRELANLPGVLKNAGENALIKQIFPVENVNEKQPLTPGSITSALEARLDPKLSFEWRANFPINFKQGSSKFDGFFCESANLPLPYYEAEGIFRNGRKVYYAGFRDLGSLTVTLYEDVLMSTMQYINTWRNQIRNENPDDPEASTAYSPASTYKQDITFSMVAVNGDNTGGLDYVELFRITYGGCWPTETSGYQFNADNGRIQVSQTFSVTDFSLKEISSFSTPDSDNNDTNNGQIDGPSILTSPFESIQNILQRAGDPFATTTQQAKQILRVASGVKGAIERNTTGLFNISFT